MSQFTVRLVWRSVVLSLALQSGVGAQTTDATQQLDSVDAIKGKAALELRLSEPTPGTDKCDVVGNDYQLDYDCASSSLPSGAGSFFVSGDPLFSPNGIPANLTSFAACQRAADRSLYCLLNSVTFAGQIRQPVTRWNESGDYDDIFDCTDPALGLDRRRSNPCTSMTVDLAGNIWLGGRDGSAHSVIKVVRIAQGAAETSCPAGFAASGGLAAQPMKKISSAFDFDSNNDYCFLRYASGRPVIVDMSSIDGTYGTRFEGLNDSLLGPGVLLLEDRRTAVFVADAFTPTQVPLRPVPVELASGKTGWGLVGSESVQSVTLLQLCPTVVDNQRKCAPADDRHNYLLATTSGGRVVARRTDAPSGTTVQPFQTLARCTPSSPCATSPVPQYWVRVSPESGQVYVSDRGRGQVDRLSVPVKFPATTMDPTSTNTFKVEDTLSTTTSSTTDTLNTLSVSPGIGIDLRDCGVDGIACVLAPDRGNASGLGAELSNVQIVVSATNPGTGMAVFKISGIPDCRQPPHLNAGYCPAAATATPGGYLDVAPLLPPEVRDLFTESTTPKLSELKLLIGPQYRARQTGDPETNNRFGAIFGRTDDDVVFRDTFDLKFDIGDLSGSGTTRCGFDPGSAATQDKSAANWDPLLTVSERYPVVSSVNGTALAPSGTPLYTEMLVNTDCVNPTGGAGDRWSLYAYGLMPAVCTASGSEECKRYFVDLLQSLYDDLERARALTACTNVDGNVGGAPLVDDPNGFKPCTALKADWNSAKPKLDSCIGAVRDKKQSATDENCQAFESQFKKYLVTLGTVTVNGSDKANRVGELEARWKVIDYIFRDQFLPSVPFLP